jgi:uncharacterized protein YyaL (SSP411 family)
MRTVCAALTAAALIVPALGAEPDGGNGAIAWQDWSDAAFTRARGEGRLVLLDLGAGWCHWCHVMDATSYRDLEVVRLIARRFVAVKVDQDSRPDLASRYEDYGWPATVVFDAEGRELVKLRGYLPPPRLLSLLQAVADDPTPGPSVTGVPEPSLAEGTLTPALEAELQALHLQRYDHKHRGWGFIHKYLDADSVEWSLLRARGGDREAERMARETVDQVVAHLLDPVWGGIYQYSDSGVWENPHFEKIMSFQADALRSLASAYAQWGDPAHLRAARQVHRFLRAFLRGPDGAFFASQDADLVRGEHSAAYFALDDAGRRRLGVPRVDTHVYTRENGWAIQGLVALHAATGEAEPLEDALAAARFLLRERTLPGGGFRHDAALGGAGGPESAPASPSVAGFTPATRDDGPYLGDTLAAGRAFLALYAATADRAWLARAEDAARFMARTFRQPGTPGLITAPPATRVDRGRPQRDENVAAARFANLLAHYTGRAEHRQLAEHALRYLADGEVARRFSTASVLLAAGEMARDPLHLTVVGPRDDAAVAALHRAALRLPATYTRVEVWDRREGPLPSADVEYPVLARPAAFVCDGARCSAPSYTAEQLADRVARFSARPAPAAPAAGAGSSPRATSGSGR